MTSHKPMMLRFNPAWVDQPEFKDWLVSVTNDVSRAYCRWCAIVLRAHKTDLTNHGSTQRHIKNESRGTGPSGPISVQIVANNEDEEEDKKPSTEHSSPVFYSQKRNRYRIEWENVPELKNWLTQCKADSTKAYCRCCRIKLRAHKHDLLIHGKSTKHKKVEADFDFTAVVSDEDQVGDGDDSRTSISNGHFLAPEVTTAEYEDGSNSADDKNGSDEDWPPSPPSPTPKKAKLNRIQRQRPSLSGAAQLTATEVVRAIERDEFNGYELLNIVKAAVPKL